MAEHECETFDFPVKQGSFESVRVSKRTAAELQETLKLAEDRAEKEGTDAMKGETCNGECQKSVYVEATIDSIELRKPSGTFPLPGGKGGYVNMIVGVTWKAGILCFKNPGTK